jgi:hypothetical protein
MVNRNDRLTEDEAELEVAMFQFLLDLRGIFVSFFKNDLDWDRINKEELND